MKKRALLLCISTVVVLVSLFAGCGSGGNGDGTTDPATAGKWDEMVWDTGVWGD